MLRSITRPSPKEALAGPIVDLAPLPAGAQFLNVIESVFSGMARAVIANSNYQSVEEARAAIERYIQDRNEKFQIHRQNALAGKYGGWSVNLHGFPHQITVRTHAIADLKSANGRRKQVLEFGPLAQLSRP